MAYTSKNPTLSRRSGPRSALLKMQSNALLQHKRIITTLAKAKALSRYIAPILTHARCYSQKDINHAHRQAFASLGNKHTVQEIFGIILPAVKDRPGGYTRVIKMGQRKGDAAQMALIELVDFNKLFQKHKRVRTRRSRRKKI